MVSAKNDEWRVIESLLPTGWEESARTTNAFRRVRYTREPSELLRLLLFHAVNGTGLRETVAQAKAAGLASMSQVGLYKRLRTSGAWLDWIAGSLCASFRERPRPADGMRLRALDSTTIQGPASKGTEWRLHYTVSLSTLSCDWHELTDATGSELLERTPVTPGDVLIADRNYLRAEGARAVVSAGGDLVVRMRWTHPVMTDAKGRKFSALTRARRLRVSAVGDWPVNLVVKGGQPVSGRVVAIRLPAPIAARAKQRASKQSLKKGKTPDVRSLEAAHFVIVFTTLSKKKLAAPAVLELYRFRWQIELVFKRLKQLLKLGLLPHKDPTTARTWIAAKLVVAFLLEKIYRNSRALSPWGFDLDRLPT